MKTIKITAHNKISIIDVDFGDYKAMQKAVGGYVETVATEQMYDFFKRPVIMLVDEEGHMKELELNVIGTVFYGTYCGRYCSSTAGRHVRRRHGRY